MGSGDALQAPTDSPCRVHSQLYRSYKASLHRTERPETCYPSAEAALSRSHVQSSLRPHVQPLAQRPPSPAAGTLVLKPNCFNQTGDMFLDGNKQSGKRLLGFNCSFNCQSHEALIGNAYALCIYAHCL